MARQRTRMDGSDTLAALGAVAKRFEGFEPAADVLTEVRSVPTIFPQIDVATRVYGWPLQRVAVIHGPSNNGKTVLCHGLGLSFLQRFHFYKLVDAEFTTDMRWLRALMGAHADWPGFVAMRPKSYEQTTKAVRDSVNVLAEARAKKQLPEDTSALIVVDSIRKLVPENVLAQIEKEKGGVDGRGGTTAMYKAALNAAWLDELVPLLYHTNSTMVIIAREAEKIDAGKYEVKWKVGGGKSVVYDSSIAARVTRAEWVTEGEGKGARVLGERHRVAIYKTKIAGKDDKEVVAHFHTSNGVDAPEGFDCARDVFELAVDHGVVKRDGHTYLDAESGEVLGKGEHAAVRMLRQRMDLCRELEQRAKAKAHAAVQAGGLIAHESADAPESAGSMHAELDAVFTTAEQERETKPGYRKGKAKQHATS